MTRGRYIAFEGSEGCGKSTHAATLAGALDAVLTRETGGTAIGRRIREILHDTSVTDLSPRSEALLAAADRAQHIAEVVEPALSAGRHVVSDRTVYSTLAYQGYGRGLSLDHIRSINDWAVQGLWPELVLLLEVPVEVVERRLQKRQLDRFEQEDRAFFERVRAAYAELARKEPGRVRLIDGSKAPEEVKAQIEKAIAGI